MNVYVSFSPDEILRLRFVLEETNRLTASDPNVNPNVKDEIKVLYHKIVEAAGK